MKGFIRKATFATCLATGLLSAAGCYESYDDLVDPCWPQRYTAIAREEVNAPLATQANNGMVLDQTVWNYHFRTGTDELTPGGLALLDRLARRRPAPVSEVFMQTAHDVTYGGKPAEFAKERADVDGSRVKAVADYLAAVRPDVSFNVTVHDPNPVGMSGIEAGYAVRDMYAGAIGSWQVRPRSTSQNLPTAAGQPAPLTMLEGARAQPQQQQQPQPTRTGTPAGTGTPTGGTTTPPAP